MYICFFNANTKVQTIFKAAKYIPARFMHRRMRGRRRWKIESGKLKNRRKAQYIKPKYSYEHEFFG